MSTYAYVVCLDGRPHIVETKQGPALDIQNYLAAHGDCRPGTIISLVTVAKIQEIRVLVRATPKEPR